MQDNSRPEKPRISGPKPTIPAKPVIPSKPKYVPPVKTQRKPPDNSSSVNPPRHLHLPEYAKELNNTNETGAYKHSDKKIDYRECFTSERKEFVKTNIKYDEYKSSFISEKCDKFNTNFEAYKKVEEIIQKAPNSPSTVCCSILSNATTDCCGIININKGEMGGKNMTKLDSVDSNSSDSGGFKDFIQLDLNKKPSPENDVPKPGIYPTHQRKSSQPDFLLEKKLSEHKPYGHQRKSSQPDYMSSEVRQSIAQNKQNFIANAQALAQFLPQTEQKILQHNKQSYDRTDDCNFRQQIAKYNAPQKTDETKTKPKPIITHGQFQQSTKKLEELLSQRLEKDKVVRKGQSCLVDGESSQDVEQKMLVQKQIQQKLQADLQQTVKHIQEIQSIELRLPQNRKWNESNRSQPAIGLKHTPKSRVSFNYFFIEEVAVYRLGAKMLYDFFCLTIAM